MEHRLWPDLTTFQSDFRARPAEIETISRLKPTSRFSKRALNLQEWLA